VPAFLESSKPKLTVLFQGRTQDLDDVADATVWRLAASWSAESFRGLYAGIADDALNLL
jgi:hypothetical protein